MLAARAPPRREPAASAGATLAGALAATLAARVALLARARFGAQRRSAVARVGTALRRTTLSAREGIPAARWRRSGR